MSNEPSIGRITRTKQQAQESYDRISGWYDSLEGNWESALRAAGLRELAVAEGESALDIGFATGHSTLALANSVGATGHVFGIDLSPKMGELANARIRAQGCAARVDLVCGDAAHLPLAGNQLDAIFMSFTLELFDTPEIPQVLAECKRVLREGGRLGVISLSKAGKSSVMRDVYEWLHEKLPQLIDCRPIFVQRSIQAAGFQVLDATLAGIWGLPVEVVLARRV